MAEPAQGAQHGVGRGLAQATETGGPHHGAELLQLRKVGRGGAAFAEAIEQARQLHRARPAGEALAAALGHVEAHEVAGHLRHRGGFPDHHHAAGSHHRAEGPQALVVHRCVEEGSGDAASGRPAGLDSLHRPIRCPTPHRLDDGAQAGAHRHLHQAGVAHGTGEGEHLGATAALGAHRRVPGAALPQDRRHGREGFDVVDQGGGAPQTRLGRVGRAHPRRAPLPLD